MTPWRFGVDDDDGLGADLHGRVAAAAGDHVDVALHRQNLELGLARRRLPRLPHRLPDMSTRAVAATVGPPHLAASIARRNSGT